MKRPLLRAVASALALSSILACDDEDTGAAAASPDPGDGGPAVCSPPPAPQKPAASCDVTIDLPPVAAVKHVPEGTPIEYCSNPPSSGQHYPIWAAFQEYTAPIEWPYLVHSMEHGAIVLLYKCDPACPEVVEALRNVRDATPVDPLCNATTPRRIIIAPSSTIPTQVAAAAWGATYQASCVDAPTLDAFIRDHYAKGPENFCNPGRVF